MIRLLRQTKLNFCLQMLFALPVVMLKEHIGREIFRSCKVSGEHGILDLFCCRKKQGDSHYEFPSPTEFSV